MNIEETIERIKRKITIGECEKNIGIPVYISDLKAVLSELEKKEAVINEMAEWITKIDPTIYCDKSKCDENCKECVIKEFTNKVEREGK